MELKIEYINKDELKPYANNAKIHTAEQIEQIKQSIRDFGFNDPIAVWKDNEIIEGHGRMIAVMEMPEIKEVPIIRLDNLSEEQRKAYTLVHNKLTMNTDFNIPVLDIELDEIESFNMDEYGFYVSGIDWATIDDLTEENFEKSTTPKIMCPKCNYIGPKSLFKSANDTEDDADEE